MKWLDAASILALAASAGALVATAVGTGGGTRTAGRPPSSPVVVDAAGREVMPLDSVAGIDGSVGVILVGSPPADSVSSAPADAEPSVLTKSTKPKPSVSAKSPKPPPAAGCININTAPESALVTLKGIGPALAARIISYRNDSGQFKKKEEIMNVKGIGPAKFAAIESMICL